MGWIQAWIASFDLSCLWTGIYHLNGTMTVGEPSELLAGQ